MSFLKKLIGSNRELDYNRVSDTRSLISFFLRRGNLLAQVVDRAKWYMAPKLFHVVDFPTHLDIEASVSCQMRCPMCQRYEMPPAMKNGVMDFELYKNIINECSRRSVYSVKLSWRGEPLLNPRIADMVRYAKQRGIKDVAFLTNGERLSTDTARELVDAGLDWISFSIDGLGEIYERIRYPETFQGITEKVSLLRGCRESRGRFKPLIRIQTIWGAIKDDPEAYFTYWKNIADKIYIIADQLRWEPGSFTRNTNYVCLEPYRRMTIGWNGIVPQCISDYSQRNCLGDVTLNSIYDIWHGETFSRLRETVRSGNLFVNEPCTMCHDPGFMYEKTIRVAGRTIKLGLHKNQTIDIATLDARPQAREAKAND